MIYNKNPKFIFLHIAKAGGSSITKTLANYLGVNRDDYRNSSSKFLKIKDLLLDHYFPLCNDTKNLDEYYLFSCVRNPYSRLVSYFNYRQQIRKPPNNLPKDLKFEDWIKSGDFRELTRMTDQLCIDGKVSSRIDYIARLENIEKDWPIICSGLGISPPLIHDKQSKHEHYSSYYDHETVKIVYDFYKDDIVTFGYNFNF